jgi:hypothetical protein
MASDDHLNRIGDSADASNSSPHWGVWEVFLMSESAARIRLGFAIVGALLLVILAPSGCVTHHHHSYDRRVVSVPPRTAEHGYVHHYHGVRLVFERSWNGYLAIDHPHHYFYGDHYYRWHRGRWQKASRLNGPWGWAELHAVPSGLDRHHARSQRREWRHEVIDSRHDGAREGRKEYRAAEREQRKERREDARERRDDHREAAKERREEHREVVKERRDDRRETAKERRSERREVAKEKRETRRETAKKASKSKGGAAKDGGTGEEHDDSIPANQVAP